MLNELTRLEIFSRDFRLRDKGIVSFPKMEYDYISIDNISVTIENIVQAEEQDYIILSGRTEKFHGIIVEINYKNKTTILEIRPLIEILDVDIWHDVSTLTAKSIEEFIGNMIQETYIDNEDELQNITGLSIELLTETMGAVLDFNGNEVNIYDVCIEALRLYRLTVDFEIDIMKRKILCKIGIATPVIRTIECGLYNVIDSEVVFKQKKKSYNKIIVIGEYAEESEQYGQIEKRIFFMDSDGTVTQNPKQRTWPVSWKIETLEVDEDFEEKAYAKAVTQLTNKDYNNYIKIEVRNNDPLIKKENFSMGQRGRIIKNGIEYISIFTGYKMDKTTTLYFGLVRTEYTKSIRKGGRK